MKCVALVASPRKNGNCDILIDEVIAGMGDAEVSKYYLGDMNIEPCHACNHCFEGNGCAFSDDGAKIIDEILDADAVIFGTPIYYGQMSAQGKLLTDRFYFTSKLANGKSLEGKKTILIFTHGAPTGVYDQYIELTTASPFGHCKMDVVDTLDIGGITEAGAIKEHVDVMAHAKEMGSNL